MKWLWAAASASSVMAATGDVFWGLAVLYGFGAAFSVADTPAESGEEG